MRAWFTVHVQSIANLRTPQAHQVGCFVYTEGIFAPKLCGQIVDVFSRASTVKLRVRQGLGPGYKVALAHGELII
jgi:hypothetical protein